MITRQAQVISAEMVDTKKGDKQYLKVVLRGEDGKEGKQAVFDPKIQETLRKAHEMGCWVENTLEKEKDFWNIKSSKLLPNTPGPIPPASIKEADTIPSTAEKAAPIRDSKYWANRDQRGLEIAWGQAINCAVARMGVGAVGDSFFKVMEEAANRFYPIILDGPQMEQDTFVVGDAIPIEHIPYPTEHTDGMVIWKEPVTIEEGNVVLTRNGVIAWAKTQGYGDTKGMADVEGVTTAMRKGDFTRAVELLKTAKVEGVKL